MTGLVLVLAVLVPGYGSTRAQEMPQQAAGAGAPSAAHSAAEISEVQKKADSGDPEAQYALGNAYQDGNGLRKNLQQAAIWYRKAADQGNAKAQNSLGILYWVGDGVDKDKQQAVQWYRKAARQGNANAMFNLGAAYYNGEGVAAVNDTLAYAWFLLSSEAGSSSGQEAAQRSKGERGPGAFNDACFTIGEMYDKGEDLPHNVQSATAWYRRAAERGHSQAQVNLAAFAMKANDYSEARRWCELAAKAGHAGGSLCLGNLYQRGLGVTQNSKEAIKYYQQAARDGNHGGMHALAEMYASGDGTKEDRQEAFFWLLYSARRGDKDSARDAQKLRSSMSDKEWKDAQKKLVRGGLDPKQIDAILQTASQP